MPRYYFDIRDGALTVDDTGIEFSDAHAARDAAIQALPNIARDEIGIRQSREVAVTMRDADNRAVFTASLTLTAKWLVENV